MKIKSYFAQSVHEAMQKARFELGPEALLLSSKKASPNSDAAYEVVFGLSHDDRPEPSISAPVLTSSEQNVCQQLEELRQQIAHVQRSIVAQTPVLKATSEPDGSIEQLLVAGFSLGRAQDLAQGAQARTSSAPHQSLEKPAESTRKTRKRTPPATTTTAMPTSTRKRRSRSATNHGWSTDTLLDEIEDRFAVAPELGSASHD